MELAAFISRHRPPPAKLLEIGSGSGALALALVDAGYDVTAIDPAAPPGDAFRRIKFEDLEEDEAYDLVVAQLSLHHITDLGGALDKVVRLLRGRGVVVVDEFAWDRLDAATAEWLHGQRQVLGAAGHAHEVPETLEGCCREWEAEHVGLHGYEALRAGLDARFEERFFEWRPYLYRLLDGAAGEALEQSLIDDDAILATGFRYVGAPRD